MGGEWGESGGEWGRVGDTESKSNLDHYGVNVTTRVVDKAQGQ